MEDWNKKLCTAAEEGNLKDVELSLQNGANLEYENVSEVEIFDHEKWGRTPLMYAAMEGHLEVVMYLVTHGSQLDATDGHGQTPLMLAAERGHLEVVMYLVTHGSQLEATDHIGWTPLMLAAWEGQLEVVMFLVTHGSQLEARDTLDGETALYCAAQNGQIDTTKWLIDQGCSPWVKSKKVKLMQQLSIIYRFTVNEIKEDVYVYD
ncbi:fibronectin type 3 and ankyrin repeat domains 1 protein-like [Mytilus edulis]|uniref:fibronectin type 3 and ankyrin repeat domains 1 protein-like n=1 Tax=Mytilus edulis TaxID=6550 RepID=UPI0039F04DF9